MNPTEQKEKLIVDLRKLYDTHFGKPSGKDQGLEAVLLAKPIGELRSLCKQLEIKTTAKAEQTTLIEKIRDLIHFRSQLRNIEGRLDILPDGSGFLSNVSYFAASVHGTKTEDANDIYRISVPAALLTEFHLKQDDIVAGQRRWPYATDGEADLVLLKVYEINHVPVEPPKKFSPSLQGRLPDLPVPVSGQEDDYDSSNQESSEKDEWVEPHAGPAGPCEKCEHMRMGLSAARPAFDAVLDVLKTHLQSTYTQRAQEERQMSAEFISERESNQQYSTVEYTRRPTVPRFIYCGVNEFSGKAYCCEVKNLDNQCADFTPKLNFPSPHACKTCAHNQTPSSKWVQTVEEITGTDKKGQPVRELIRQALQFQAETEYQTCLDAIGILPTRPGTLPLCEVYSTNNESADPRYVIGPVVNAGERCARWLRGVDTAKEENLAKLDKLVARAQRAVNEYKFPAVLDDNVVATSTERQRVAGNALADVIEYCLISVGADPEFIESACSQYTLDVWYNKRKKLNLESALSSSDASGASNHVSSAPSQPIQLNVRSLYRHPVYTDLTITIYQYPPWFVAQVNKISGGGQDLFDLSRFQPGVWTRLQGQRGPLPIALSVVGPPLNQFFVTWLP